MLNFDRALSIQGHTVYRDENIKQVFYVLPTNPSYRLDANGHPLFKFIKYRKPLDRPNGKAGGFLIADVEFTVADDMFKKITIDLQAILDQEFKAIGKPAPKVEIAMPYFKRGAANIQFLDNGGSLVQKVWNPASPSLYGKYVTPFTIEMSEQGVQVAEAALQGKGGAVQVSYDLFTDVKLPPLEVLVWFNASKFYEFRQQVNIDWSMWGQDDYRETMQEQWRSSEASGVEVNPGSVIDRKVIDSVRDWGYRSLDEAVKRMAIGDIAGVSEDMRKVPPGIDNLWRDISVSKMADFRRTYKEGQAMEWNAGGKGTLPNITTLKGKDGKPLNWKDYYVEVDGDDPFFRQLNVTMQVNADFKQLPIHSVEVKLNYPKKGGGMEVFEEPFTNPDDVKKFAAYIVDDQTKYKWSYQVNYKGQSKRYQSPIMETDEKSLVVNVDDMGILNMNVIAGDLDFDQIKSAQVTVRYEDQTNHVAKIERQFTLDANRLEYKFQQAIFQPVTQDVQYRVKYLMKNGKEFLSDWMASAPPNLVINDVWSATRSVLIRATGDLSEKVEGVFLDLTYTDEANKYSQTKSVALNDNTPSEEWVFPVINETSGQIVYSGTIKYRDGSEEAIAPTTTTKNSIFVGPKVLGFLEVEVAPDLIDFDMVKLVKVALQYEDVANGLNIRKDITFRPGSTDPVIWKVELKDKTKVKYKWQATFFPQGGGSPVKSAQETTDELTLYPQFPTDA